MIPILSDGPKHARETQELTGTWEVHPSSDPGQVQLTVRRGRSTNGRTMALADLERLARNDARIGVHDALSDPPRGRHVHDRGHVP